MDEEERKRMIDEKHKIAVREMEEYFKNHYYKKYQ